MQRLTSKQKQVYQIIKDFIVEKQKSPTTRELQKEMSKCGFQVSSLRTVTQYLDYLEKKGFIKRTGGKRGIKLVESIEEVAKPVPILGTANAGDPVVFAEEEYRGYIRISKKLLPREENLFTVKVKGDSMNREIINGEKLEDGAYAIIDPNNCAPRKNDNSPYLFSVDGCATIKRIKTDDNKITLFPNSTSEHEPIILHHEDDFQILGKVVRIFNY